VRLDVGLGAYLEGDRLGGIKRGPGIGFASSVDGVDPVMEKAARILGP
jgi:hypothetical protein